MGKLIPLFQPYSTRETEANVKRVLRSGWWTMGKEVEIFEQEFAEYVGSSYAVAVNSGTAALHLAVLATIDSPGEVIVPALTFASTALAPLYAGHKIVFADSTEDLNIDWIDVSTKINNKTKAIIPVHYAGRDALIGRNWQADIPIIEDSAHATGTKWSRNLNIACWSFHAVKNLPAGDGGMITTDDIKIAERLKKLRWCGIDKSTYERENKGYNWKYNIKEIGYKYHMNDLIAAIGRAQLLKVDEDNRERQRVALAYIYGLAGVPWLKLPTYDENMSWHLFVIRVNDRDQFINYMLDNNISVGVHYRPLNQYDIFPDAKLPYIDQAWKDMVTLPIYPNLTMQDQQYIINTINKFK